MPDCKACGKWFATVEQCELCPTCERALERLRNYAAPVVHGHWKTNSDRPDTLICSVCKCGFDMWKHDPHNFCPNCGAKMNGGED